MGEHETVPSVPRCDVETQGLTREGDVSADSVLKADVQALVYETLEQALRYEEKCTVRATLNRLSN